MSYIDRNALGIGYAKREIFNDPAYADGWNAAIEILENTPDADVEPIRHGEWMHDKSTWENRWICSECGYKWFFEPTEGTYCPNCGSKMDKGET